MVNGEIQAQRHRIVVHPGEFHIGRSPMVLSTLLGSCIAVCIYEPVADVMGMNHFLLVGQRKNVGKSAITSDGGRYGIHAMELLINGMLKSGAQRSRLRAKAFGGGKVLGTSSDDQNGFECVSRANVRFVLEFLKNDGIPLLAADLGGNFGRQIHFMGDDYSAYVKKIYSQQTRVLLEEELRHWRDSRQKNYLNQAEFW